MRTLPPAIMVCLDHFAPVFSRRVWQHVLVLIGGALLAPGRRTVASALRVMGLGHLRQFPRYHRVLSRDVWSGRAASRVLLGLVVRAFVPDGPLVIGVDETIERRWGRKIAAKGVYRDPVRSTRDTFVKTRGLRWVSMMLLAPIPWTARVWALPFLTVLAPSELYNRQHHLRHRTVIDWARQMMLLVRRWYPDRTLVFVGDSTYATIPLLVWCQSLSTPVTFITRLRLDAAL